MARPFLFVETEADAFRPALIDESAACIWESRAGSTGIVEILPEVEDRRIGLIGWNVGGRGHAFP